ncbi:hypothetical protein A9Q83_13570 [Alphaproteobacteria bacterium 46_93_T64]|nr:hypothetical protein A9Q83_13570 [Alphaproteobacteria bacterium 46_93_T64]
MGQLENELGALRARIENLHLNMVELRDDVKSLSSQVSMGRGAIRVVGIIGGLLVAVTTFAAWIGQTLKPFNP